jgi:hypothetical protein
VCAPRDASASSFLRLHSVPTIMNLSCRPALTIFFGPWPSRHLTSILYQETSLHGPSHSPHQVGSLCASALPDHCRRGWAPTMRVCAHHIALGVDICFAICPSNFQFATSGLFKPTHKVTAQVDICHGGLLFMSLSRNQRTHWKVEITLWYHAC